MKLPTLSTTQKVVLAFALVCVAFAIWAKYSAPMQTRADVRELTTRADTEVSAATSAEYLKYWKTTVAPCFGLEAKGAPETWRYFLGWRLPPSWGSDNAAPLWLGSVNQLRGFILMKPPFVNMKLVGHEQVHLATGLPGHPQKYFSEANAARCGIGASEDYKDPK